VIETDRQDVFAALSQREEHEAEANAANSAAEHRRPASVTGTARNSAHAENISKLFREHNESLMRFLVLKLGSQQDARDIAQEAYVRILGLGNAEVITHLRAYLFRTANNLALDRLRGRLRGHSALAAFARDHSTQTQPSPEEGVDSSNKIALMRQLLQELPPKCRQAFLLCKFECMSYAEIAAKMNLTESMIRKYVLRAVRYCQDRLEESGND
jgi:RNA polymerase sigma-70 factor (ECF subfamily)